MPFGVFTPVAGLTSHPVSSAAQAPGPPTQSIILPLGANMEDGEMQDGPSETTYSWTALHKESILNNNARPDL